MPRSRGRDDVYSAGARALVVDDSRAMASLLLRMLSDLGLVADWALSIERAVERLARETFDLVVADCPLHDGSGSTLLQSLRRADGHVPRFVLLTNRPESAPTGNPGVVWLAKPFPASDLRQALERLGIARGQASGRQS